MKISSTWKSGKSGKKKQRPTYRPKIRWELLGLSDPQNAELATSIETIRKQVSALTREGFGLESRTPERLMNPSGRGRSKPTAGIRTRRRDTAE